MKRYGNLFQQITSLDNLSFAFDKATKGKKWRENIKEAIKNKVQIILSIQDQLKNHTYHTSHYHTKVIHEPKERVIYVLPFAPDRIVHHAIMHVVEPIFEKKLIYDTYACRIGKGQIKASARCLEYTKKYKYCLQLDVAKFYPSIPHQQLKEQLRTIFKDKELLWLLDDIIDSVEGDRNVPIGNYLSQWFGNLYLSMLDRFIISQGHSKLVRYCDDLLVFSNDKQSLNNLKGKVNTYIVDSLKLNLSRADTIRTSKGIKFLGYRHFPQGFKLLKRKTAQRIKRRCSLIAKNKIKYIKLDRVKGQLASAIGWLKYCNSYNFRNTLNLASLCTRFNVCNRLVVSMYDVEDFLEPKEQLGISVPITVLINKAVVFYGSKICKKRNRELLRLHFKLLDNTLTEKQRVYVSFTESKRMMFLFEKYKNKFPFTARIIKQNKAYSLVSVKRDMTMKGFPKHLNTKADYEYIKANFDRELWLPEYQKLLESYKDWFFIKELESEEEGITDDTHKVVVSEQDDKTTYSQYELQENPNAKLFRIGYTVSEVEQIVNE